MPIADEIAQLTPGQLLVGKYRIDKTLGEGGMGVVFLAENVDLGRRVAIKVLLPQAAGHPEMVARFRQEARAAAAIGHPGIVDVLDLGRTEEGAEFIVMEHLRGETLGDRVTREGALPVPMALEILGHLLDALEAAHQNGIVHRDLKPDNIFLVSEPVPAVKILDFGISKLSGQKEQVVHTATGAVMGTPLYMSPEQALADPDIGPTTDLYSLGAILYQMLGGKPPFATDNMARLMLMITSEVPAPVTTLREDLSGDLGSLVMDLLKKTPTERPQTATELKQRLASMGLVSPSSTGDSTLDRTLAPLPADETLAPHPTVTGPGETDTALAETTASQPAMTGPGTGTGATNLTLPKKPRTPLWIGAGLVVVAVLAYPSVRHCSKSPPPAVGLDSAVLAPDAGSVAEAPDSRAAADLVLPDARRAPPTTRQPRPKTKKPKKGDAGRSKPSPVAKPPPGGLGLPPPEKDNDAVKGQKGSR